MILRRRLVVFLTRRDPYFLLPVGGAQILGPALTALEAWWAEAKEAGADAPGKASVTVLAPAATRGFEAFAAAVAERAPGIEVKASDQVVPKAGEFLTVVVPSGETAGLEAMATLMVAVESGRHVGEVWVLQAPVQSGAPPEIRKLPGPEQPAMAPLAREPAPAYRVETKPRIPGPEAMGIIGRSPGMMKAIELCQTVGVHDVPVLVQGDTGTGKEVFARYVHACSDRLDKPFVAVNCGALPDSLIESLLFGHAKGAFTGAVQSSKGKFMEADGGTLFLDEIGELPLEQQPKLLRVLQEGVVEPIGGRPKAVDVRVVAATHRPLMELVGKGEFREDLYYRLAYATIELPPLRQRLEDIPALATAFIFDHNQCLREPKRLSAAAVKRLQAHSWPGNVRELQNVIGRSMLLCSSEEVDAADLMIQPPMMESYDFHLPTLADDFELEAFISELRTALMEHALKITGENQSAAARLLGVSNVAVHHFVKKRKAATQDKPT